MRHISFHVKLIRQSTIFLMIIVFITLIYIKSFSYFQCRTSPFFNLISKSNSLTNLIINKDKQTAVDDYSIWCLHMAHRLDSEQYYSLSSTLQSPSINSSRLNRLPYRYSLWKSSSLLPRRLTPCEHSLVIRLLMIIERICRKYHITYMMSDGTLLGSLRHHDMIPWDDDIDLMIPIHQSKRFIKVIKKMKHTLVKYRIISDKRKKRDYLKIFFRYTKSAGDLSWNFPFVDIFFYEQNQTHLWQVADPDTTKNIQYIFPLIMRPFGELWLPAPHNARQLFKFDPFDQCQSHFWDHRKENTQKQISQKCKFFKHVYPFVDYRDRSTSKEVLKINNTIIHTVIY